MVNDQDVAGESQGTQQHQQVALLELQRAAHAQQVQAKNGDDHADPELHAHFFVEKQAQDGDNDDVHGGDEARLAHGGVLHPHLLQAGGHAQGKAAAQAADEQCLAVGPLFGSPFLTFEAAEKQDDRNQRHAAHEGPAGIEGEGAEMVHAHGLGHEAGAPDDGGQEQQAEIFCGKMIHRVRFSLLK